MEPIPPSAGHSQKNPISPSRIPTFEEQQVVPMPRPISPEYVKKLAEYQKAKQDNLVKIKSEMDGEVKASPLVSIKSQELAAARREKQKIEVVKPHTTNSRLFNKEFEHQKSERQLNIEKLEAQKIKDEQAAKVLEKAPWKRPALTEAERDELAQKGYTFKPTIDKSIDVNHDGTELDFLYSWQKQKIEKIEKLRRTVNDRRMVGVTFVPERKDTKVAEKQYLKDAELEKLPAHDRILKRSAINLKNYKGVEVKDEQESTYNPVINDKSRQMVESKRSADVFQSLYKTGVEKIAQQKANEEQKFDEQNMDLELMFNEGLKADVVPGREANILDRFERQKQKHIEEEARRRIDDMELRRVKLTDRSQILAQQRREKIESGTYQSIRKPHVEPVVKQSVVCEGTRNILKNKEANWVPATERLYNYARVMQTQKMASPKQEVAAQYTFKPEINSKIMVSSSFEERQQKYLEKRAQLELLKKRKEDAEVQKINELKFKPELVSKNFTRILHETSTAAELMKISGSAAIANDKFVQRLRQSRSDKVKAELGTVPDITKWKIEPTAQQPFQFRSANELQIKEQQNDEVLGFLELLDEQLAEGQNEAAQPRDVLDSQIDVKATTREAAQLGEVSLQIENEAFTQFHRMASAIVHNKLDGADYAERRRQRGKEMVE